MMNRQWLHRLLTTAGVLVFAAATAAPAAAQVFQVQRGDTRHSLGFNLGYFWLTGEDGRHEDDVILADAVDLVPFDSDESRLKPKDFNHVSFEGEYLFSFSKYLEAGVGVGYFKNTVHTVYQDLVNENGSEIQQDLALRIVPITATVRLLPLGRGGPVEPYVGGGVGFFNYRWSEIGDFVNESGNVFSNLDDPFIGEGTAVGPVLVGGVRFPVGDALTFGGEVKWQSAKGDTGGFDEGFLGDKIDLGGTTLNFAVQIRF